MESLPEADDPTGKHLALDDRCMFRLSGPDRVRYLNGQVSNDVAGDLDQRSAPACLCTLKGKVEFLVWIHARDDALWIDGPLAGREALHERLDRYLIADDCELEDVTGQGSLFHHFVPGVEGVLSKRTTVEGRDLWVPEEAPSPFSPSDRLDTDFLVREEILAGIPRAPTEITGNEFPAELEIDGWAVDFHKGCYLGQEVVSRIESVGKVRRHLVRVIAETPFRALAELRNDEIGTGECSRDSFRIEEKIHLGFAWFRTMPESSQPVHCEAVGRA